MSNHFSDYQKEVFYDIYKTALGAFLSTKEHGEFTIEELKDAVKVAINSVTLLTNEHGIRKPSEIVDDLRLSPSAPWPPVSTRSLSTAEVTSSMAELKVWQTLPVKAASYSNH